MLFGHACRESTIEGKLFKFHWHRASYPLRRTPASLLHSLRQMHAYIRMCRLLCDAYVVHDGMRRMQETELASGISFRLCSYLPRCKLPFSGPYAFYDYEINRMSNCHPCNTLENRKDSCNKILKRCTCDVSIILYCYIVF